MTHLRIRISLVSRFDGAQETVTLVYGRKYVAGFVQHTFEAKQIIAA